MDALSKDYSEHYPLHAAIRLDDADTAANLINKGKGINRLDDQDYTALFWALHHKNKHITELLMANNCTLLEVEVLSD